MARVLSIQEMQSRYSGEWLLIAYTELDKEMKVVRGEVPAHSPNRGNIYRALSAAKGRKVAVEYAGTMQKTWRWCCETFP